MMKYIKINQKIQIILLINNLLYSPIKKLLKTNN